VNPLTPLYNAVAWVIEQIHTGLSTFLSPASGLAWVLTIVILVVLMRLILVPLFIKQMHATRKMSALAPQLAELKKKYKNDRQTLNEETMRLYKENGANPLAGCLPLLGQMPLFFALFSVLRAISGWHPGLPLPYGLSRTLVLSAQHADIFGAHIPDKFLFPLPGQTLESRIVILIAVLISVTTTYLTVRQSTKRGMTPQMTPDNPMAASQKYMAYIVPLFALSGLYWAFGLVMYWVTTNVWTLGQQYVLFKRYPMPTPGTAAGVAGPGGTTIPAKPAVTGKPVSGKALPAKPAGSAAKPAAAAASRTQPGRKPSTAPSSAKPATGSGQAPANGSGRLRRLTRRAEPEAPPPPPPDTKLVRQQPSRQSRRKRSGKR
jgi:YidC/Oxa1 family membrane protein insertase